MTAEPHARDVISADVAILGGGIAGLTAGALLARSGRRVCLIEQDPVPIGVTATSAFERWTRPSVTQWRMPHTFSARLLELLRVHLPDVIRNLSSAGIDVDAEAVPGSGVKSIRSRRPALELALHDVADAQPHLDILHGRRGVGICVDGSAPPVVRGIELDDGRRVNARVTLDCAGRRSPVSRWLRPHADIPSVVSDCGLTYYARYFQRRSPEVPRLPRADLGGLLYWSFPGDGSTLGIAFGADPSIPVLKNLRRTRCWDALAAAIDDLAPLMDAVVSRPLHDVQVMGSLRNIRRHYTDGGRPRVLGLLSLGDAVVTTNPLFGWGVSIAVMHALDAVAALDDDRDLWAVAQNYDARTRQSTDPLWRMSTLGDRARLARWRGQPWADEDEQDEGAVLAALFHPNLDIDIRRRLVRRVALLDPPDAIRSDPNLLARIRAAVRGDSMPDVSYREVVASCA